MKVRIVAGKYLVSLSKEEVMRLCRPGAGADTCIWLAAGGEGFDCLYFCREVPNLLGETLKARWEASKTVAKRDGCPEVETMRSVIILKRQGMTDEEALEFVAGCEKGLQARKEGKIRPWEEVKKELGLE